MGKEKEIKYRIENDNILVYEHTMRNPDKVRQFRVEGAAPNNMKVPNINKGFLNEFLNFFNVTDLNSLDSKSLVVGKNYKIDVKKFIEHVESIKKYFKESLFAGKAFSFKNLDLKKEFAYGDISITLRTVKRKDDEVVIQFGKHDSKRGKDNVTPEEIEFERFVFGGLFGGEFCDGKTYSFVEICIDKENKEIYHRINEEKLNETLKGIEEYHKNLFNNVDDTLDYKIYEELDELLDLTPDQNKIIFERVENLSKIHSEMQTEISKVCEKFNLKVISEYLNRIDLFIEGNNQYLIELKTSPSDIFKAIGQVLCYEKLTKQNVKKIIVVYNEFELEDFIKESLLELDILVIRYENLINNFSEIIV